MDNASILLCIIRKKKKKKKTGEMFKVSGLYYRKKYVAEMNIYEKNGENFEDFINEHGDIDEHGVAYTPDKLYKLCGKFS